MTVHQINAVNFAKLAKFAIIFSVFIALYVALFPGKIAVITILFSYPLIVFLFFSLNKKVFIIFDGNKFIFLFLFYNLIVLFRGFFVAKTEEDWKTIFASSIPLFLFVHFTIYLTAYKASLISIFSAFLSYGLFFCFFIFFIHVDYTNGFPKAISPIYILLMLIPYLDRRYTIFILSLTFVSFLSDLTNRSNMLNIIVAIGILSTFFWKNKRQILGLMKLIRMFFLTLPVLFLILGVTGIFNIFLIGQAYADLKIDDDREDAQEVFIDSRTPIYVDVFAELLKDDAILFGLGAAGKTKTTLAEIEYGNLADVYKEGRRSTESGILNYIQWGGLIGGFFYFLLFVKASYYGLYKSKNWFCVMLGLWIAYKGFFSFIEDSLSFSISSLFIFLPLGICMNKKIRQMSDSDLKLMFRYIINKTTVLRFLNTNQKFSRINKQRL